MSAVWNVELHSHSLWSKDCVVSFEAIIECCRQRGIHKIAVTDHNTADGALLMQALAPDLVIVGEEIMTTEGEILAYFVQESIPAMLTPAETIRRLRDQGAIISVAHPFDRLRKGAWEKDALLRIADKVDALEVFNARCVFKEDNLLSQKFARAHGLAGTAGSDAHSILEYGTTYVKMPVFDGPAEFLVALRQAEYVNRYSSFWVHGFSSAAKWSKKLGLKPRQWAGG